MTLALPLLEQSQVADARRRVGEVARSAGLDEADVGRLSIVVTELGTNLVKHARGGGELLVDRRGTPAGDAIEVISIDRGPGIEDLARCLDDGYTTAGTAGTGLGAVRRMADTFDAHSTPGRGSAFIARVASGAHTSSETRTASFDVGTICAPLSGQPVCGDAWAVRETERGALLVVADGLGHGPEAAMASSAAMRVFHQSSSEDPSALLAAMHVALRHTRGAAIAIAAVDKATGQVRYAGIGNISARLYDGAESRSLVSHAGTVGHEVRKVQEFHYPWSRTSVLIAHSDGCGTRWDLNDYPDLRGRAPSIIAAVLYRDFRRKHDDVCIAALRARAS